MRRDDVTDAVGLAELDEIVSARCDTHEAIDNVLRAYLSFTANYKGRSKPVEHGSCQRRDRDSEAREREDPSADGGKDEYLRSEYDVARCSYKLLESGVFQAHNDYVRRQIIFCLLQVRVPAPQWRRNHSLTDA